MCSHLCRLDIAIRLGREKNKFHVLEGEEGKFIGGRFGVTALVSARKALQ